MPHAVRFDASKILIEGFEEETDDEYFTGASQNMHLFNLILHGWGIPVCVAWRNRKEMDTVKDLYQHRPEWMPHVCNCFTRKCYKSTHRLFCTRRFPSLKLYDSQCGLCIKCRIVNLGRILYSPEKISPEDARAFLESTKRWIPEKMETHADMIEGSFMRDFESACRRLDVPLV